MLLVRCMKDGLDKIKKGQELRVVYIENGDYHFKREDSRKGLPGYSPEDFEIIRADKVIYHGESNPLDCIDGHEYIVLGATDDGELYVVDESGDDYLYFQEEFIGAYSED